MKASEKEAAKCRQVLSELQISVGSPGTILKDIQVLIDFIGVGGIPTKSKQGNLPSGMLPELNARLSQPIQVDLKRPLLRDYPNLAGLYVLLRVMNLAVTDEVRVSISEPVLARWSSLNPAEKYFALLEAWLFHADSSVLGTNQRRSEDQFDVNLRFLTAKVSSQWTTFDESVHLYDFLGAITTWNTQLQVQFGLIEVQPRPAEGRRFGGRGWMMEQARRTPWGEAVSWAILELLNLKGDKLLFHYELPEAAGFGFLQPAFQPYFPDWQKTFTVPQPDFRPGLYILKVSMDERYGGGAIWRRLAVPDSASLDDVAYAVLGAFQFEDTDHLYEFRFRDQMGKAGAYFHPYTDEGPYGDKITLGETDLPEKGIMKFLFDYGDCWRFVLRLERIDPPDKKARKIKVIASAGQAPKQYPDWEEE